MAVLCILKLPVVVASAPGARVGDTISVSQADFQPLYNRGAVEPVVPIPPEITSISLPPFYWQLVYGSPGWP
jgi:hypothetical protein